MLNRKSILLVASAGLALAAAACGSSKPAATATPTATPSTEPTPTASAQNFQVAFSDKPRIESPDVPAADISSLVTGDNAFALDLYRQLSSKDGNLFLSPHSISVALAMTYAGARGDTASEMADTLHFTLSQADLHAAMNALDQELASRGEGLPADEKFTLDIANSIWGQQGFRFEQGFLDTLAQDYGSWSTSWTRRPVR